MSVISLAHFKLLDSPRADWFALDSLVLEDAGSCDRLRCWSRLLHLSWHLFVSRLLVVKQEVLSVDCDLSAFSCLDWLLGSLNEECVSVVLVLGVLDHLD